MVSMLLTACNVTVSSVPQGLTNAVQLLIGIGVRVRVRVRVRFTRGFVHPAPLWLDSVAMATR
jgi:hypothetical protein